MGFLSRLTNLWRRDRLSEDIEDELRAHLELSADDLAHTGLRADEARRVARQRLGNVATIHERVADANTVVILDGIVRDVRHALGQLWRSPAFTLAAVATLALGIGATTAVFTLVHQVMLRDLPVVRPTELVRVGDDVRCCYVKGYAQNNWTFFSWDAYQHFRADTPGFESLAAFQVGVAELAVRRSTTSAAAEARVGEYVSGNFFATLGVSAWRGRLFDDADDRIGATPVAVLSFQTWTDKYNSDSSVVGASYVMNGHAITIVGITPPGFYGAKIVAGGIPDLWLPLSTEPLIAGETSRLKNPALAWLDVIGRVPPAVDRYALEAQLNGELQQWLSTHRGEMNAEEASAQARQTLHLTSARGGVSLMREQYDRALQLLLFGALSVLLVACTNIATLLLVRGMRDQRVTALRAALGASRARLIREVLARSIVLSVFGGVAGIGVAYAGARLILSLAFAGRDAWIPIAPTPSLPVLLFALALTLVTSIVFGVAPAILAARVDPITLLRGGARSIGARRALSQKGLVAAQVALSVTLVSVAAMLGQSLRNLERQNFGFATDGRYLISIDSKVSNRAADQLDPMFRDIESRLRTIPGVRAASPVLYAPLSGYYWSHSIRIEGQPEPASDDRYTTAWTRVTLNFFETLGDKILMGRAFTDGDDAGARPVAVISQTFARKYFGNENPIGRHFGPAPRVNSARYEIVGVAADVQFFSGVDGDERPMYFVLEAQQTHFDDAELQSREVWSHYLYSIVVWAPGNPPGLEASVKGVLAAVDPNLVVYNVRSYTQVVHAQFAQQSLIASLASLFGIVTLILAAIGLYGVTAYNVEQRTSELGVRMALGAQQRSVVAMVLRGAMQPATVGLFIGIPAAVLVGRLISSELFGVAPWDGVLLGACVALFVLATLAAAAIPAWRAGRVTPMHALRAE